MRPLGRRSLRRTARELAQWVFICTTIWAMLVPAPALFAASQTWNGSTGDTKWSTVGNWVGTPAAPPGAIANKTSTDTATFSNGAGVNTTVFIDLATQNIGSISFDTPTAQAFTIGSLGPNAGNSLFLTSGGTIQITAAETNAITETINAPLLLEGGYTFADNSTNAGSSLVFNGNVALDSGVAASTLTFAGANNVTDNGVISNGGVNALALTKNGAGILFLNGANTYTGVNTLTAGVVNLGVAENVGISGPLGKSAAANAGNIVLGGGTLQYTTSNQFDYSGRFSTAANQKYNVDINGQNVTWATNLSSTNGLLTVGSTPGGGTLFLNGNNSFNTTATAATAVITINGGTLQVGNAGALNAAGQGNFATTTMSTTNNAVLSINGFGTQATPIIVNGITSGSTAAASNATVQNGAATPAWVAFNNPAVTTQFAGTIQDGGAGSLNVIKNGAFNLVLVHANTYSGKTILNGGVVAYFANGAQGNGGAGSLLINANGAFTDNQSAAAGVGGVIPLATLASMLDPNSDGGFGLGFNNPDSETLTFGGPVFMGAGGGNFSTFNGTMNAVQNTLAGSAETYPNYHFGSGLPGQLAINSSGGALLTDGSSLHQGVVVQGALKTANGGSQAVLSSWNTLANDGAGGSGGGAATITQGGTIELQGQNTYTGDTLVNVVSTLFPNANNATLSTLAILQVNNSSVTSGGVLVSGPIGRGNLHISQGGLQDGGLPVVLNNHVVLDGNAIFSSQGNGTLTFNSVGLTTPVTFDISNNPSLIVKNISTTISNAITGNSTLTSAGIGNLILDGNNTFTGNITINPATMTATAANGNTQTIFGLGWGGMQFNSPAAIGNAANTITVNSGAFAAPGPNYTNLQSTFFNRITTASNGTIALTASTADNFDWSSATGANLGTSLGAVAGSNVSYSGTLTPNGGTYRLGGGGGALTVTSLLSGANSLSVFPSNQTSTSALSMNGTLILTGANTYSGGTTVSGTARASYFNPGNGNNANPGNFVSNLQIAANSSMSGGTLNSGPLGTGTVTFVNEPAIEDNGTNILVANSLVSNPSNPNNTAFTEEPMAFNSAGNGSLTFDGGPSATFNIATTPAGQSWVVNNFTTIKDTITGTLTYTTGNVFHTISGTGTLLLADQGTWNYSGFLPGDNNVNHSTLLVAGPALRFGTSSTLTGTVGSQTFVSGPLGLGTLAINGAGNVGSFLQDNGSNITLANRLTANLGNPIKFDSTGNGSITLDGTGLSTPAAINILGTNTLTLLADNTVVINDRIVGGNAATAAILTIGNNNNTFPYGTVVLNQPYNSSTAVPGSTYSGGFNANFGTVVFGASSILNGTTLVSGPAGTGTVTMAGNFPLVEDNGTTITIANSIATGGNIIFNSATGAGSLVFDGTARGLNAGNLVPVSPPAPRISSTTRRRSRTRSPRINR